MAQGSASADARQARLEEVAASYTANHAFTGTVLVVEGEKRLLDKGYGQADLEWNIPNAPDVKFRLGSLTKQFTAALVLLAEADGKLHLGDPVSKYLPDAPGVWASITIADLLGHTSGIPNFTSDPGFMAWRMNPRKPEEILAFFRDKPLDFAPGTKFAYSNSNYEVLGVILEKISGKSYGDLLHDRLFAPLGMKDTGLDHDELILPRRAQGYLRDAEGGLAHAVSESMSIPWAAGSIYSTTGDLLRWERALFGGEVLPPASLKKMLTPGQGDYGLGVFITQHDGLTRVDHAGGIEGFSTYLAYLPDRGIAIIVLSNISSGAPDAMGGKLLDIVLGKSVILPGERKEQPIPAADLPMFAGTYQLVPNFALVVTPTANGLTAQATGQSAFPLFYAGKSGNNFRFFFKVVDAEVEFVPDAAGGITSLILHQGGRDMPAPRK